MMVPEMKISKQSQVNKITLPGDKNMMRVAVLNGTLPGLSLVLRRTKSGAVTASYVVRSEGQDKSIGPITRWTLAEAQEKHRQIIANMKRRLPATAKTSTVPRDLNALFRAYLDTDHAPAASTIKTYTSTWEKHCVKLTTYGATKIEDFTDDGAHDLIRHIAVNHSVNTAQKIRNMLKALNKFLKARYGKTTFASLLTMQDLLGRNNTALERSKQARTNYLSKDQLRALWAYLCEDEARPAHLAARMLICAPLRKGEVINARWSEVDLKADLWKIPGTRTKNGFPLTVPISREMKKIFVLAGLCSDGERIFGIGSSAINHRLPDMRKACGNAELTVHDLRRTASTLSAKDEITNPGTGLTFLEADLMLNHVKGIKKQASAVADVYQQETLAAMVTAAIAKYQKWLVKVL
ncbi:tyrosine-type recombinase/integrase [Enterobacter roggenkampii]|uniref:tyrosine-type recombinase/integrase n=1 Tax=Enterobacter roggenkampii TaxID=1812935 RepID=UPI002076142C|nr:tyrosine-type recombinase/integrase [Enterobacter roggenkampii]MCM7083346.1 tyrosine-type recombinase/integrase [Enterobacter roggenkampii]